MRRTFIDAGIRFLRDALMTGGVISARAFTLRRAVRAGGGAGASAVRWVLPLPAARFARSSRGEHRFARFARSARGARVIAVA